MAKKLVCKKCRINKNESGTKGLCRKCALNEGFKACSKCNKMFIQRLPRQRICPKCRVNSASGWGIGPYGGAAGLGKS